jgi:hypothetical protein
MPRSCADLDAGAVAAPTRSLPAPAPSSAAAPTAGPARVDRRVDGRVLGALALIVAVGAGFRFWGLGAQRLGFDDAFTTMAARMPLHDLFGYLRAHDSHPPLDYLLRAPISHLTTSEWWLRFPSALCSLAALALFAWWMRTRGWLGVVATALFAVSSFQIAHGREIRMYPELELLGVAAAIIAESWLTSPRRWHARVIGVLAFACLMLHVSGFLLGAGLLVLAGRRTDREAWRWRRALAFALGAWAVLWGSSFLTQSRGGHSDWIPHTTPTRLVDTVGRLLTTAPHLLLFMCAAIVAGAVVLVRADRRLGRVWLCCVAVPIGLAALTGTVAPVLLDRTLTVSAWGAALAVAYLLDRVARSSKALGVLAIAVTAVVMVPAAVQAVTRPSTPDVALRHLDTVVAPGDVVAIRPAVKAPELAWSIGPRAHRNLRTADVDRLANNAAYEVESPGGAATVPTGRIWLLDWNRRSIEPGFVDCAPPWHSGTARILCLRAAGG